ncbi:MAG TPA: carboxypeptidase regulatory-like domain-containing protein [Acidobacteriaceae bacterium]|nr:carboxypeptidase regulatory-like domain-containing protein [Acidobacteriaceae bacterium]
MKPIQLLNLCFALALVAGCSGKVKTESSPAPKAEPAPVYFKVDPDTAGTVNGQIHFKGHRPPPKAIDMSEEPACVEAHKGKAYDESLVVNRKGDLANVFVYIKSGLEGKNFPAPSDPVVIDQKGCWFHPRVLGIQTGQTLKVINSDPVTHNIHPMAQVNREWNHSQGMGDPPIVRRFIKPEIMIPVKCNIHSWMHAYIGVVDNPYFAVTGDDGKFAIKNLPPGTYTLAVWQEKLGTQEQQITVPPHGDVEANFIFKGE